MNIVDINAEARSLVDATSTSYPDTTLLRRVNSAYQETVNDILNADGTWQFDDTNFTTNPEGTGTLVASQSSYSFAEDFLDIEWVKVLGVDNYWHLLKPIDQSEMVRPLEDYLIQSGMPLYYDKNGNTIKLYPAPSATNITLADGLKVKFTRTADVFTSGDVSTGTKEPGFAVNHVILAYKAALPYAASHKKDRVAYLMSEIKRMRDEIIDFYARREKDKRKKITTKQISFR
jgi:hypothetical protein